MAATNDRTDSALSWKVSGMDCGGCVAKVRGTLEKLPGVSDVQLSLMSETLKLALDEKVTTRETVEQRVKSLGFGIAVIASQADRPVLSEASWKIGGMDCASCVAKVRGAVEKLLDHKYKNGNFREFAERVHESIRRTRRRLGTVVFAQDVPRPERSINRKGVVKSDNGGSA